jgi:hypothetical protein
MTLKSYLWGLRIWTLFSLVAWGLVVYYIDPDKTGILGQALFFASLFLALSGLLILFSTWVRRKINGPELALAQLGMSFRQGILLALLVIILLIFQKLRILIWWDGLLVAGGIFLIELYFLSK